jgi:hypothetical protein
MKIKSLIDFFNNVNPQQLNISLKRMKINVYYSSKKFNKVYLLYKI